MILYSNKQSRQKDSSFLNQTEIKGNKDNLNNLSDNKDYNDSAMFRVAKKILKEHKMAFKELGKWLYLMMKK